MCAKVENPSGLIRNRRIKKRSVHGKSVVFAVFAAYVYAAALHFFKHGFIKNFAEQIFRKLCVIYGFYNAFVAKVYYFMGVFCTVRVPKGIYCGSPALLQRSSPQRRWSSISMSPKQANSAPIFLALHRAVSMAR